ncbi:hypothetical protein MKZ38_000717 [Zalerion maritima]|uniref:CorA-like transporter domain-containing protein n=1 Tax=Zalerion maritima TaxID=339359 RepID=A0AAD5RR72_9PEZI|nr:hypothetical protein MKZ38_000717 [Zalerion maritima]
MAPFMLVPLAQNISADNIISKRQAETSEVEIIATKIEPHRYYSYRGRNSNMSGNNKSQVLFKESMDNSLSYPQNLIHTSHFDYALKAYTGRILGLKDDLFHHTKQLVWITELQIDKDVFVPYGKDKTKQLVEGSLNESGVDPRCRYIHIQSDSNRGPLGCDQNQLCRILTHHQVSPSFLDILLTFSRCETPSPYCMFRRESHLSDEKSEHSIPSLGRSGVQFEHSFNLLSVEESNPEEGSPWSVRRTGAYNSFDVVDNRSVWIVLKGNRLIRKRLDAEAASHRHMKGSVLQTREGTLRSILATHLLIMEWAVEKWHPYIAYLEKKATKGSNVSITAPIDQEAEDEPAMVQSIASPPPSRRGTFRSRTYSFPRRIPSGLTEKEDSGYSSMGLQKIPSGEPSPELQQKFSWKAISAVNGQSLNSPGTLQPPASVEEPADVNPEYANLERVLTFDAIQHLNYVRKEMAEAIQAIEQNLSIFKEIKKYYTELQTLDDFEAHMDPAESRTILAKFFSRLGSLQSDLEKTLGSLKMQLGCLDSELKMRYSAIQFKGAKWSQHFAVTGHQVTTEMASWTAEMAETTTRMHTIAEKTEQETVSMHFITVLTLIFLPGTFLAVRFGAPALELISQMAALTFGQTFFSSGIFHWDEDTKVDSEYQVRGSGLALFGMICLPLTAVVMLIWVAVYKRCWTWIRRKPQETASTDVEKGELPQNMYIVLLAVVTCSSTVSSLVSHSHTSTSQATCALVNGAVPFGSGIQKSEVLDWMDPTYT